MREKAEKIINDIINHFGYIIISSSIPEKEIIQRLELVADMKVEISQPFLIIGEATEKEFNEQRKFAGLSECKLTGEYLYKCITD